jgi:NAD(P)-dependent dehydrogenase (short-subunit alcohol dehydrogenase family)
MSTASKVWFITGTSSGFGRALAEEVIARGDRVVATAGAPTLRLPLGADAVKSIRDKLSQVAADVDRSEHIAAATAL